MAISTPNNRTEKPKNVGTQTLMRGLSLLVEVADGISDVKGLSAKLGTPRSTTHRMLAMLVAQGYLHQIPYRGYLLGSKLIYLGSVAQEQMPLLALARPHLDALASHTGDTIYLAIRDENTVLYLDKIPGTRGLEMRSRVGMRNPLASTGVGKALLIGMSSERWPFFYADAVADQQRSGISSKLLPWEAYQAALLSYQQQGWVFDLEERELGIRCVAAPIRDVYGKVIASISVASADLYMPHLRMAELGPVVLKTAQAISRDLGWSS